MRLALRHASRILVSESASPIPTFLCPALLRLPRISPVNRIWQSQPSRTFTVFRRKRQQVEAETEAEALAPAEAQHVPSSFPRLTLPRSCPGCGAPTQVVDKKEAGYYNIDRGVVKAYLDYDPNAHQEQDREENIYANALNNADPKLLEELGVQKEVLDASPAAANAAPDTPVCDRCHNLQHHHFGNPIHHPSITAIQETIAESPHRRNHIYHVIDAADFPLSLVPNLQSALHLPKLRTQNRRAKHKGWIARDRIAEVSFIITRSDLLAPQKEQVDSLMPYFQDVLRSALRRVDRKARLGNVYLVSAKRGWWTKKVKEDIWERGGAGWMVGKVNVGKSNLFENVFPKGRGDEVEDASKVRSVVEDETRQRAHDPVLEPAVLQPEANEERILEDDMDYDEGSLLPPPQPYTPFPVLPMASPLPGTTASPIRIPFGRNKGELIDMPGLARTTPELSAFVKREHHTDLVMRHRVSPDRHVLKPGQSLLLGGGLIRLTPVTEELIFLVYPFVPLLPHVTANEKAVGIQDQTLEKDVPSVLLPKVGSQMKSAGIFPLKWDITKKVAGPLTSSVAGKMKPENLPFKVWGTDILIEGVGWVEVSAQVRRPKGWRPVGMVKKDPNHARTQKLEEREQIRKENALKYAGFEGGGDAFDRAGVRGSDHARQEVSEEWQPEDDDFPEIEVFSPLGKFVGARQPMCGSVLGGPKQISSRERKARPRRSMVSVKRQRKPQAKA